MLSKYKTDKIETLQCPISLKKTTNVMALQNLLQI